MSGSFDRNGDLLPMNHVDPEEFGAIYLSARKQGHSIEEAVGGTVAGAAMMEEHRTPPVEKDFEEYVKDEVCCNGDCPCGSDSEERYVADLKRAEAAVLESEINQAIIDFEDALEAEEPELFAETSAFREGDDPWPRDRFETVPIVFGDQSKQTPDMVEHPPHYNFGQFEVIDVIEDWELTYNLGNVVKYVARSPHKGNAIEDLKKAAFYLNREVERLDSTANTGGSQ